MNLLHVVLLLVVVGVVLWGVRRLLPVVPVEDPMRTAIWVVCVVAAVLYVVRALFGFALW